MSTIQNKSVLITGGARGLGKQLGEKMLAEGARHLIIWDTDKGNMQQTVDHFSRQGYTVYPYKVDISEFKQVYEAAQLVLKEVGSVDILINNAGVVTGKSFPNYSPEEIEHTLRVNVNGTLHTCRAFITSMIEQNSGHIVNISSAVSLMGNPNMSVYAGSKWAVTGWSESLRIELENAHPNLQLSTIQPSFIDTGMFEGARPPLLTPLLDSEVIAGKIVNAIKQNKTVVREPFMVKLLPLLKGILPRRAFDFIAGKVFGVYNSMKLFTEQQSSSK